MRVLMAPLADPEAIRYRQQVLSDCLDRPQVIRSMYAVAAGALDDRRHLWAGYGGSYQDASSNLSGAVRHLEAYVTRLRELRRIADDHAPEFRSGGMRTLFATLQRDLSDDYFDEISGHLKQLRFRRGAAQLAHQADSDPTWQAATACSAGSCAGSLGKRGDQRLRPAVEQSGTGERRVHARWVVVGDPAI